MRVLAVTASVSDCSRSKSLLLRFVEGLRTAENLEVKIRDVGKTPPPHLTELQLKLFADSTLPDPEGVCSISNELIEELRWADVILISTPIYNWAIPSTLKCWIDQVVRLNHTFITTPTGIDGLLQEVPKGWENRNYNTKKRVILFVSSGLTPAEHITRYLRSVLKFIGITRVQSVDCVHLMQDNIPEEAKQLCDETLVTFLKNQPKED
ncbi:FMN-dependent NADH-azoreductase [Gregarina niphandrodes]|uniref:FMN-dependent NADH-azoreductase n=1 Tax=Gregarina niphandrodes TaxID=110365 RepID=A0A023B0G2_GRENI|nr:FMN-dependent NADH-azoreductase [Gregarina niphandrodes]EZG44207.1 FMN-dependent NADH-azoreductase [Gregarina niphandrodes]|eukprot:XP_011132760.1 FMN-dependent NADH-azoreductase [Gregarina niphandrodes]